MTKFWASVLVLLTLLVIPFTGAMATDYPSYQGWVNDYEGLMTQVQVDQLNSDISKLEETTNIEIAVVTIGSFDGQTAEDYAIGIGDSWGVGKEGKNNGIVFLVSSKERQAYIRFADGIYTTNNQAAAERILENIRSYFKTGDYGQGIVIGVQSLIEQVNPTSVTKTQSKSQSNETSGITEGQVMIALGIIAAVIALIVVTVSIFRRRHLLKEEIGYSFNQCNNEIRIYSTSFNMIKNQLKSFGEDGTDQWAQLILKGITVPISLSGAFKIIVDTRKQYPLLKFQEKLQSFMQEELEPARERLDKLNSLVSDLKFYETSIGVLKPLIKRLETDLKKAREKYPNENWQDIENRLSLMPDKCSPLLAKFTVVKQNMKNSTLNDATWALSSFLNHELTPVRNELDEIDSTIIGVDEAYKKGPELMKEVERLLERAKNESDIPERVRRHLEESKESFNSASLMMNRPNFSWWLIYPLLLSSMNHYDSAENTRAEIAREEAHRAEAARQAQTASNFTSFGGGSGFSSGGGAGTSW